LRLGAVPVLSNESQRLLHSLATELLNTNRIGDALYKQGIKTYGERGMNELVGIVGITRWLR